MQNYAVCFVDNGTVYYLVLFGYDGGSWRIQFSCGDIFSPVKLQDRHSAYNLLNLIASMYPRYAGSLYVEEVDINA